MSNTSSLDEQHRLDGCAVMDVYAVVVPSHKDLQQRLDIGWWREDVRSASDHALDCTAAYFRNNGIAGEAAWLALQTIAEKQGDLYLTRTSDGIVQSQKRERNDCHVTERRYPDCHVTKRRYPNSDEYYTEAETIDFVFMQEGSLRFAMNMWHNEMLGSFDPTICDR